MLFVNSIANIVHLHCTSTDGHPNKNVGDAFLLVWKKHDTWQESDDQTQEIKNDGKGGANAPGAEAGSGAAASSENKDKGGSGRAKSIEETRRQWQQIADGAMRCIMRIISEMESLNAAVAQEKLAGNDGGKVWLVLWCATVGVGAVRGVMVHGNAVECIGMRFHTHTRCPIFCDAGERNWTSARCR